MKSACVYAHFDLHGEVDKYVLYYLSELKKSVDCILVVTTVSLSKSAVSSLDRLGVEVLQRENVGYDFYSYKAGIESLKLTDFDELVLCNDSVYGPFCGLGSIFARMRTHGTDFWGMTDSYDYSHHLQSYFLVFGKEVIRSASFSQFWDNVDVLSSKIDIIRRYEVGLSRALVEQGFEFGAVATVEDSGIIRQLASDFPYYLNVIFRRFMNPDFWGDGYRVLTGQWKVGSNPTHLNWKSLIEESGVPFVKVALLRDNPKGLEDLEEIFGIIGRQSDYPVQLIADHLNRVARD